MFDEILKKWTHLRVAYKGWRFFKMCEEIGFALLNTVSLAHAPIVSLVQNGWWAQFGNKNSVQTSSNWSMYSIDIVFFFCGGGWCWIIWSFVVPYVFPLCSHSQSASEYVVNSNSLPLICFAQHCPLGSYIAGPILGLNMF